MKAVVAAFNQEKALVGAFSVITNVRMELFQALLPAPATDWARLKGWWVGGGWADGALALALGWQPVIWWPAFKDIVSGIENAVQNWSTIHSQHPKPSGLQVPQGESNIKQIDLPWTPYLADCYPPSPSTQVYLAVIVPTMMTEDDWMSGWSGWSGGCWTRV